MNELVGGAKPQLYLGPPSRTHLHAPVNYLTYFAINQLFFETLVRKLLPPQIL